MKFVCDNCSTQYLISDDKIAGKGVKVRCKRCGHVIVLKPEAAAAPALDAAGLPTDPSGQPLGAARRGTDEVGEAFDQLLQGGVGGGDDDDDDAQATEIFRMEDVKRSRRQPDSMSSRLDEVFAGSDSTEIQSGGGATRGDWYLAIGDEQVGPMKLSEVEARWAAGEIGPRTLAWQTGMAEWKAIREMDGLRHLLEQAKPDAGRPSSAAPQEEAPEARPAAKDPSAELWSANRRSELASLVEEEMEAAVKAPAASPGKAAAAAGFDLADAGEVPPWERDDSVVSGEVARPSESYFDSSLDARPEDGKSNAAYSRSGSVLAGPAYLGGGRRAGSRMKLIAAAAGAGLIVVGAAVAYFAFLKEPPPDPAGTVEPLERDPAASPGKDGPAAGGPSAEAPAGDRPAAGAERPAGDGPGGEPDQPAGASDRPPGDEQIVVKRPGEALPPDKPDDPKKPRVVPGARTKPPGAGVKPPKGPGKPVTDKPKPPDKPPPAAEAEASGDVPQKLAQADVGKALQKFVPAMKGCVQQQQQRDPSVTGTMVVTFTIAPSGSVSSFTVSTKEHEGTYVASCISYIIKSIKFPKAREPFTVPKLPLKLGG